MSIWVVLPFTPILNGLAQFVMIRRTNFKALAFTKHHELRRTQNEEHALNISVVTSNPTNRNTDPVNHRIN